MKIPAIKLVKFHIIDNETNKPIYKSTVTIDGDKYYTKSNGEVIIELPIKDNYDITIHKKDYNDYTLNSIVDNTINIGLSKVE